MQQRTIEIYVGLFILLGILALLTLALRVSDLSHTGEDGYFLTASFDNIGDLKPRAPVTIAGVRVGHIQTITLNPNSYRADVTIYMRKDVTNMPTDTSASVLTQGLLGSNYVELQPGYANEILKNGDKISQTHSALILENLIGQLLFKIGGEDKEKKGQ